MSVFAAILLIAAALAFYVLWFRAWARDRWPAFGYFLDRVEPIEQALWRCSRTIFVARAQAAVGYALAAHDLIVPILGPIITELSGAGLDGSTLLPGEAGKYVGLALIISGHVFSALRKITTDPLD